MKRLDRSGFTIVEMLVVISISTMLTTMVFGFWWYFWQYGTHSQDAIDVMTERLNAGDTLREYLSASSGMITQNSIADAHVGSEDPANPGGGYWVPIHAIPGSKSGSGIVPIVYFRRPAINTSNQIVMNGAAPYEDEFIVYLDGSSNTLYLRTLANPSVTDSKAVTSCPPSSASATCPKDIQLINNISAVELRYFSRAGNLIDYTSSVDPDTGDYIGPDFPSVEVVELKLRVTKTVLGEPTNPLTNSTIIRVALRNS
jgi:prepilin-type N-terminal cleavage/methylation domain-containing protein